MAVKKAVFLFLLTAAPLFAARTLTVISFDNLTSDTSLSWLSEGITVTLTEKLASCSEIVLVERTKLRSVLGEIALGQSGAVNEKTAQQAGKLVGAQVMVTGAYQKSRNDIRITASLTDVETAGILGSLSVTGNIRRIFDLQDEIAVKLLGALKVSVSKDILGKIKTDPTSSIDAYEWYARSLTKDDDDKIFCLKKALEFDPKYSYALEDLYALQKRMEGYRGERDWHEEAQLQKLRKTLTDNPSAAGQQATMVLNSLLMAQKYDRLIITGGMVLETARSTPSLASIADIALYYMVTSYYYKQDYNRFFLEGEKFLKNFPGSMYFGSVDQLMKSAITLRKSGKLSEDATILSASMDTISMLNGKGKYNEALPYCQQLIDLASKYPQFSSMVEAGYLYGVQANVGIGNRREAVRWRDAYRAKYPAGTHLEAMENLLSK